MREQCKLNMLQHTQVLLHVFLAPLKHAFSPYPLARLVNFVSDTKQPTVYTSCTNKILNLSHQQTSYYFQHFKRELELNTRYKPKELQKKAIENMRGQNPNNKFYYFFSVHLQYTQPLIYKAVRGKCCENTEKNQAYPRGGLGSTRFYCWTQ